MWTKGKYVILNNNNKKKLKEKKKPAPMFQDENYMGMLTAAFGSRQQKKIGV